VEETTQAVTVRLRCAGLFAPGSAALDDRFVPMVDHIAAALNTVPGALTIIGHTDNQPIHNLRFPSNFELSLARAQTVRDRMLQDHTAADKLKTDGKGDKEPIADNATPGGREANRRIEFILLRSGSPS
jgi:type VI secretion system protein ImpK